MVLGKAISYLLKGGYKPKAQASRINLQEGGTAAAFYTAPLAKNRTTQVL